MGPVPLIIGVLPAARGAALRLLEMAGSRRGSRPPPPPPTRERRRRKKPQGYEVRGVRRAHSPIDSLLFRQERVHQSRIAMKKRENNNCPQKGKCEQIPTSLS